MRTEKAIDLTNINSISFKGEMYTNSNHNYWCGFFIWTKTTGSYWTTNAVLTKYVTPGTPTTEFTVDTSALSGNHYLGFGIYQGTEYVFLEQLIMEE